MMIIVPIGNKYIIYSVSLKAVFEINGLDRLDKARPGRIFGPVRDNFETESARAGTEWSRF